MDIGYFVFGSFTWFIERVPHAASLLNHPERTSMIITLFFNGEVAGVALEEFVRGLARLLPWDSSLNLSIMPGWIDGDNAQSRYPI